MKQNLVYDACISNTAAVCILTVAIRPVVSEAVSHFLIDGRHGFHVAFAPLSAEIFGLHLEQLQNEELHHGLFHLQRSL